RDAGQHKCSISHSLLSLAVHSGISKSIFLSIRGAVSFPANHDHLDPVATVASVNPGSQG
ncbi:MAG TPA: hypothetical protein VFV34_00005, partial [Blastocatellia bacterium]|nr:hypothetical protein [Blastocatellia bacterium]